MSFDVDRFRAFGLEPRQAEVPVPKLAAFFPEGEKAVWTVRALTGEEIARANASSQRNALVLAAVEALASAAAAKGEQIEALKSLIGYGEETPEDLAKRFDYLVFGSVRPVIDREIAVRLFAAFPLVGYELTNKILSLTDQGPDVGKVPRSTPIPE